MTFCSRDRVYWMIRMDYLCYWYIWALSFGTSILRHLRIWKNQPAHPHRLNRVFPVRINNLWIFANTFKVKRWKRKSRLIYGYTLAVLRIGYCYIANGFFFRRRLHMTSNTSRREESTMDLWRRAQHHFNTFRYIILLILVFYGMECDAFSIWLDISLARSYLPFLIYPKDNVTILM